MKPILLILILALLLAAPAQAQNFNRQTQARVNFWYYESVPDYGYGYYGYPRVVPFGRYQAYPVQQQFYPMSWGAIPGYNTNGYFVPGVYGW